MNKALAVGGIVISTLLGLSSVGCGSSAAGNRAAAPDASSQTDATAEEAPATTAAPAAPTTTLPTDMVFCGNVLAVENVIAQSGSSPTADEKAHAQTLSQDLISEAPSTTFSTDAVSWTQAFSSGSGANVLVALRFLDDDCAKSGYPGQDPLRTS